MMLTTRIRNVAELDGIFLPWKRLVGQSLTPAGLNSPELVLPLLKKFPGAELAVVVQGNDLLFALPIKISKSILGLVSNWITPLTVIGVPHLDREFPVAALTTFTNSLKQPLMLHAINVDSRFWDHLISRDLQFAVLNRWQRAVIRPKGTFADWFELNFDRKRRKEFRRLSNRLAELGTFETLTLEPSADIRPWIADLVSVEASGWKGRRGTAIAGSQDLQSAFSDACKLLAASGKLRFWKLVLNGKPIACAYAIVEGDQAWLVKIAYDESFAKYSPGVLLVLHATQQLFAEPGLKLIDSCAIPGHPMIENIWRDRIEMADVIVAPKSINATRFALTVKAENLRRAVRERLRDVYYLMKGKKRS